MKNKGICFIIILIIMSGRALSQTTIDFAYDENGNRITRILTVTELKSSTVSFPIDLDEIEEQDADNASEIQIFPNPFSSTIRILINGYDDNVKKSVIVYNMSGAIIKRYDSLSMDNLIALENLQEGTYIFLLRIGSENYTYKVVKGK